MPKIAVKPRVFKNYLLKIGADNYESHVSSVTAVPTTQVQTFKGGTPADIYKDAGTPDWVLQLKFAQDWETAASLSIYLLNNIGKKVAMEFSPLGSGPKFSGTVILIPGDAVGGDIESMGLAGVTLPVEGQLIFAAGVVA
jgi:hypothetical protein